MFKEAIVRRPCKAMTKGITQAGLGIPDYKLALQQHDQYIRALETCGLTITLVEADENFPDSVFIEDTAVLTRKFAIVTNPGPSSRKEEIVGVIPTLKAKFRTIEYIAAPGTLEGGDVMLAGNTFFVGKSDRTNSDGIRQFQKIVSKHGYQMVSVDMPQILHLKTGLSYLENNQILLTEDYTASTALNHFDKIITDSSEAYAANSLWVNEKVLVPAGFPSTRKKIEKAGYETLEVDVSEFRKLDGGLSCLSLRF